MLALRPFNRDDIPLLVDYLNNADVVRYLSSRIPYPYTLDDARWWVEEGAHQSIVKAITWEDVLVGAIGAEPGLFEKSHVYEIGYWLAQEYWGRGIATQALRQFTDVLADKKAITCLQATVYDGNSASQRLLLSAGFKQHGFFPKGAHKDGVYYDAFVYGKVIS